MLEAIKYAYFFFFLKIPDFTKRSLTNVHYTFILNSVCVFFRRMDADLSVPGIIVGSFLITSVA